ncbi:MAG: holo-[acyl-carrier-protein] synthase [Chloroflexota bacterium]|nr:MAG: holo-[acyl-carrier-protein] synthase [Chloroflexota bacterium]
MLRTGVDLIEIARVQAAIARYGERFTRRVYTDGELAYCAGRVPSLAARFAAKEAVSKALGVGIQHREGVAWREIEVLSAANGFPTVRLHGKAQRRARQIGVTAIALSFSHAREHALAFVIAQ